MKKFIALLLVAIMVFPVIVAIAETTPEYAYELKNGINGKKNSAKAKKETNYRVATNHVIYLSRKLSNNDPVVTKVRRGDNGNPASSISNVKTAENYYPAYNQNEGVVGRKYYLKMQNTTGSSPVVVRGTFTP